jgi:hypothetical protein
MKVVNHITSKALKSGKVELTAHLVDGSSEVIAKRVSDKPQVQFYNVEVNGNAEPGTLAAHFTIGKTINSSYKVFWEETFNVQPGEAA